MKRYFVCAFVLLLQVLYISSFAQPSKQEYLAVDEYIKKAGTYDTLSMGAISHIITRNFAPKELKTRAIFDWIALNISYDCKAGRNNDASKNTSADVLKYRKAIGVGFATLFQDMCSSANIRCLTVEGFAKRVTDNIGEKKPEINHEWAVVQLGQSPDTWYYVDPCWGAGYPDKKETTFIKAYDPSYFFADKKIFNFQHYPDNEAWKLSPASKSKKDFYELPLVKGGAYSFGVNGFIPSSGKVMIKEGKSVSFNISSSTISVINKVSLIIENNNKTAEKVMNFTALNGHIVFDYKFNDDGEFPVTILINGKETLGYIITVD